MRRLALSALALSAVHVTPVRAQWTQEVPGRVWVKTAVFIQNTDRRYDAAGKEAPWLDGGVSDATAVFTDIIVGVTPKIDFWLQVPFFDLRFSRALGDRLETTNFGDLRFWGRYQISKFAGGRLPVAIRVGAKAPVGSSPLDAEIIPVGEGQWDVEAIGEAGYSFWPAPVYSLVWFGYRARFKNDEKKKDPGGEWVYLAEAGVTPGRWLFKATLDGLEGRAWIVEGIKVPGAARRIGTLQLGGGFRLAGSLWTEAGLRFPLYGKNFPKGKQFIFGFSTRLIR